MQKIESEVIVVGAGGGGMSAAAAASSNGTEVTVVDENPEFGGQIWRRGIESKASPEALELIRRLDMQNVGFVPGTTVFDGSEDGILHATNASGLVEISFQKLIIATGARERFIPFPGWTLPNVYGAGGLQALVKSGFSVGRKRIIVAGTGPLLLAVADFLKSKGAEVLFVAEQASYDSLIKFAARLVFLPRKLVHAISFRMKTGAPKIKTNSYVVEAFGDEKLDGIRLKTGGKIKEHECDILAAGFHLEPNLELPLLLGCTRNELGIEVNDFQRTSVGKIYAAGETTGIGGIELSCVEGEIAGRAASGDQKAAEALFGKRKKLKRFADYLNQTFELRHELRNVIDEETIVCRCEDVAYGRLKEFTNYRDAKLQTRLGMGPCQGRICGGAVRYLYGWENNAVRPPIFPVPLGDLGDYEL